MTTASDLDGLLDRQPGPFSDAVLQDAYRDTPDVPEIHGHARERMHALIHECRAEGTTRVQVITGDPGEGKTHLLAWLRRASEECWRLPGDVKFALAPIAPLRAADRPFHHFLQEAVSHLGRTLPQSVHTDTATDSPLEIFLWRVFLNIARLLARSGWVSGPLAGWLESLGPNFDRYLTAFAAEAARGWAEVGQAFADAALRLREIGGVDREVFRALACFPREDARAIVVDWLGGSALPPDRAGVLGTTLALDGEAESFRTLRTLLHLSRVARVPFVLAFDQIEGTERLGEGAVADFFNALGEVFNAGGSAVLLIFCQTHVWMNLREQAQQQVRDRIEDIPPLNLRALTPDEGLALVTRRLTHFWSGLGVTPPSPLHPFSRESILAEIQEASLRTPRRILTHFRRLLADPAARARFAETGAARPRAPAPEARRPPTVPPPPPAAEIVRRKLRALLEEERGRPPRAPEARAEITLGMIREAMKAAARTGRAVGEARVEGVGALRLRGRPAPGVAITLQRGEDRRRVYVEANNSTHGQSVAATAKRLREVLAEGVADRALLVRESAFAMPPATREILAEITPRGAVVWLREDEVVPLAALEGLLNAAAAGDITVAEEEARALAFAELAAELGVVERAALAAYAAASSSPRASGPAAELLERVRGHLRERCAIEPLPRLADGLGVPIELVHAAVEALRAEGAVDVLLDRSRVPVVLLRPEILRDRRDRPVDDRSGSASANAAPPESTVRRAKASARSQR